MILDYPETFGLRLLEPENFKRFKLTLPRTAPQPEILGVTFIDAGHAPIDMALVLTLPGAPESEGWRASYHAMIQYAGTKGWLDAGRVRAHIERT